MKQTKGRKKGTRITEKQKKKQKERKHSSRKKVNDYSITEIEKKRRKNRVERKLRTTVENK